MRPRIGVTSAPVTDERRRAEKVNRAYVDALVLAGAMPLMMPVLDPADAGDMVAGLDGILFTGGGDVSATMYCEEPVPESYGVDARRDEWEFALVRAADVAGLPALAVCRGEQVLNVAAGGTLIQHLAAVTGDPHHSRERERQGIHLVAIEPTSLLASIVGEQSLFVNSLHHQAAATVGAGLRPVAWSPDGIVEALERVDGGPTLGVQWHPELMIGDVCQARLFRWLVEAAKRESDADGRGAGTATTAATGD